MRTDATSRRLRTSPNPAAAVAGEAAGTHDHSEKVASILSRGARPPELGPGGTSRPGRRELSRVRRFGMGVLRAGRAANAGWDSRMVRI